MKLSILTRTLVCAALLVAGRSSARADELACGPGCAIGPETFTYTEYFDYAGLLSGTPYAEWVITLEPGQLSSLNNTIRFDLTPTFESSDFIADGISITAAPFFDFDYNFNDNDAGFIEVNPASFDLGSVFPPFYHSQVGANGSPDNPPNLLTCTLPCAVPLPTDSLSYLWRLCGTANCYDGTASDTTPDAFVISRDDTSGNSTPEPASVSLLVAALVAVFGRKRLRAVSPSSPAC